MPDLQTTLTSALARLVAIGYPGAPATSSAADTWIAVFEEVLADVAPQDVEAAFFAYLRSSEPADRYMPTPGRIRALTPTAVLLTEAKGRSGEVWQAAVRALSNSREGAVLIRDPRTWCGAIPPEPVLRAVEAAAEACGGWLSMGQTSDPDRVLGRHFRIAYEAALARQGAPHRALPGPRSALTGPANGR